MNIYGYDTLRLCPFSANWIARSKQSTVGLNHKNMIS
jgi:hypothetical protein